MGSIASLSIRGADVFSWKNDVDPTFLVLFTAKDVVREFRRAEDVDDVQEPHATVLVATARELVDRLDFLGIGSLATESAFRENVAEALARVTDLQAVVEDELVQSRIDFLSGLTFQAWRSLTAASLYLPQSVFHDEWRNPTSTNALVRLWDDDDPRLLLRALLTAIEPDEEVRLDISDLIAGGWLDEPFDPQTAAIEYFSYAMTNGTPAVVITEGSSDARLLQAALEVRFPHLVSYVRFLDFGDGAEGSAAAGIRTLKSFAAAGIANRVVLLLDNDAAAREAVRSLKSRLPEHYAVIHYPHLALAENYPTLGPTGIAVMDVNGLAASVEMYLGADVLMNDHGELTPVQWRSFLDGVQAFQGELVGKKLIQDRFKDKLALARTGHADGSEHDWSGVDAIVLVLREVLSGEPACAR